MMETPADVRPDQLETPKIKIDLPEGGVGIALSDSFEIKGAPEKVISLGRSSFDERARML